MTQPLPQISERALAMRHAFDQSFAEPVRTAATDTADFVALRLGDETYAVAMEEIGGLHADVAVTPCPSPFPEFIGLAAFRGALTPVYDLASICGYPPATARWLLLAKGGAVAFAFAAFDSHFRIERSAIAVREQTASARYTTAVAARNGQALPIISLSSIVSGIADRVGAPPLPKGA
ncbi:MAG TPA: chemotaxis protein CheW [Devosia sp.]|nr:chemotaxis protein CheW [Devosia sp.]